MSQSERVASKDYYVAFEGVEISGDYTDFTFDAETQTADMTANNDEATYEKPLIKAYGYKMDALYRGVAGSAVMAVLVDGAEGTIEWAPEGTAVGKPKGSALAVLKKFSMSSGGANSAQTISIEWGPQGGLVDDPRSAVYA